MARGAATDFTTATETVVQQIKTWLASAQTTWNCQVFSGTNAEDVAKFVFGLRSPAAVVLYDGSTWKGAEPLRRKLNVSVLLVNENHQRETGGTTVRGMLDSAVAALDMQSSDQYLVRVMSDSAVDLGTGKGCVRLQLIVEDY
jgi:hypothetical protein